MFNPYSAGNRFENAGANKRVSSMGLWVGWDMSHTLSPIWSDMYVITFQDKKKKSYFIG